MTRFIFTIYGRATRQARPTRFEKQADLDNIFQKKFKFGLVIPARQDKWTGNEAKKYPRVYPPAC